MSQKSFTCPVWQCPRFMYVRSFQNNWVDNDHWKQGRNRYMKALTPFITATRATTDFTFTADNTVT